MNQFFIRTLQRIAYLAPGGYSLRPKLQKMRGVNIGQNVWVSQFVYFDEIHPEAITVGDNSTIGLRTSIFTHLYWGPRRSVNGFKETIIGNDVFIGPHCLILPGVRVGDGAVVKGGSALTRNVPANTLWGGSGGAPLARITVPLTPDHSYDEFVKGLRPIRKKRVDGENAGFSE